jgi:hyperosmotically inducible periplasmic protein
MARIGMFALFAFVLGCSAVRAEDAPKPAPRQDTEPIEVKADDATRNTRERVDGEKTPVNQNENKADLEITRQIRKSIVDDKSLSTYAHNIKIITQDGMVNLKGPVRSAEEKTAVEAKAFEVAGKANVKSQVEVAPKEEK